MKLKDYCEACLNTDSMSFLDAHLAGLTELLRSPKKEDIEWFKQALLVDEKKYFVAFVFGLPEFPVPEELLEPMLRAAVYEPSPSFNKYFVKPCLRTFGVGAVSEFLTETMTVGTDFEKAGAVNALYWVFGVDPPPSERGLDAEARAELALYRDLWERTQRLLLDEFIRNPNVDVRRSIISKLMLAKGRYREANEPLVNEVLRIATGHEDPYIRSRLDVQLGRSNILYALPERELPKS